jgi:uncharacterized membrane protein
MTHGQWFGQDGARRVGKVLWQSIRLLGMGVYGLWCGAGVGLIGSGYYWQAPALTQLGCVMVMVLVACQFMVGLWPFQGVHRALDRLEERLWATLDRKREKE